MEIYQEILRALGRIEGELIEIRTLSQRVSIIEQCQSRLKGAWTVLAIGLGYLFHHIHGK